VSLATTLAEPRYETDEWSLSWVLFQRYFYSFKFRTPDLNPFLLVSKSSEQKIIVFGKFANGNQTQCVVGKFTN